METYTPAAITRCPQMTVPLRAQVESQIGRWQRVIGDGLRFHTDEAQAAGVAIAAEVLDRMLDLGCQNFVRVA